MDPIRSILLALGAMALVGLHPSPAGAAAPGQICAAAKKKLVGKEAKGLTGCDAKAVAKGVTPDDACKQKVRDSYSAKWDAAEAKGGCFTQNDKGTIESKTLSHVADLESTLYLAGTSACSALKYKYAGKKAACLLACHAKAQKLGIPLSDDRIELCLQKCRDKFEASFGKAELKGDCHTTNDAPTIEAKIDAFVSDVAAALPTGVSTTTTTLPVTTLCCQAVGACLDADSDDLPIICNQLHGTVAHSGQVCNATAGTCGSTKDTALRCCQCPEPSPPYPHTGYCFESATSMCGSVCTRFEGGVCGPSSQTCNGP